MALHRLALQFDAIAEAYDRGRPEYQPQAIDRLARELGLATGARVLDLAAGTGKLTRALLGFGLDVVAVEPQQALADMLARSVGEARVRTGLAEAIPLDAESVAAVTVADAFHWFDRPRALREIRRVLEPGGGLAVLSTAVDWGGASWAHDVGTMIVELRPAHPHFDCPSWREYVESADGWGPAREIRLSFSQAASPAQVIDHIASMSWVAALPGDTRTETLARIGACIHAGHTPAEMPVRVHVGLVART